MIMQRRSEIVYPSSDGKRMSENTLQYRWITTIEAGLQGVFLNDPNVFIAADLLWYPVEGFPNISAAPAVMVVLGRPKGDRKSYKQWEEDNLAPQVVFEILSDSNEYTEMTEKQDFYEEHGVQEYYIYDPQTKKIRGFRSDGGIFRLIRPMVGRTSPLLGIRFDSQDEMVIYGPDGRRFLSHMEMEKERKRADQEKLRADEEKQRADREKQRADAAERRVVELMAQLRSQTDPTPG